MRTKKSIVTIGLLALFLFFMSVPNGYSQLEDAIEQLTGENTKGYLQPFVNSFSNNLNSGIYRTAHVSTVGLHFYVGLSGMATQIPDEDKLFMGTPPSPYAQTGVETATIFGGEGASVAGPSGLNYQFQNGLLEGDLVPFVVPHFEVGSFLGTNVKLRYFKGELPGDDGTLGEIKLLGYGIQHSLSQYIPLFPLSVSAGFFYQKFEVSDYLSTKATSFGLQVSKSIPLLTIYGAASMSSAKMDVSYTYKGGTTEEEISMELESGSQFRFTVGARLRLALIILNADYSIGDQNTATVGIGLGI
jgi:hypothetical protein